MLALASIGVSRSGEIPGSTVIVRIKESAVLASALILVISVSETFHESVRLFLFFSFLHPPSRQQLDRAGHSATTAPDAYCLYPVVLA